MTLRFIETLFRLNIKTMKHEAHETGRLCALVAEIDASRTVLPGAVGEFAGVPPTAELEALMSKPVTGCGARWWPA